jgi:hypothetical protein
MKKILIVIDMQKDFIDGALGTAEAVAIVPNVIRKIEEYEKNGDVIIYTKDTHFENYLSTKEGENLPLEHCIKGTPGHEIPENILRSNELVFEKITFGCVELADYLHTLRFDEVELVGLCTDICVVSNALLIKAQQYLEKSKNVLTSLTLTAFDLSLLDKTVDSFYLGDMIHVRSKPHKVDAAFRLEEQDIDFLHPESDRIVLGRSVASLTGSDVAGDRSSSSAIHRVERSVRADFDINQAAIVEETKLALASLIQQTSESLMFEVSEQYATGEELERAVSTTMTQLSDSFTFLFSQLEAKVDTNDTDARTQFSELEKYIRFEGGDIILGEVGNEITLRIENDRISFLDDGAEVAYFSNKQLTVLDGSFLNSLQVGSFKFLPRANGNLSLVKIGG